MKTIVAANLFRGMEAVGGELHFEEEKMVFNSHSLNIQTGSTTILYSDIQSVGNFNTLGVFPNGMYIKNKDGQEFKFVVWNRKELISFIKSKANILE